ncbi:MAG: Hpt domain-containing protein [Bacteroidia bacterium]|nr:Hpt domain-containing protein [Bacteroidia bacterium]
MKYQVFDTPLLDEKRMEHLRKNGGGNGFSTEITEMFTLRSSELIVDLDKETLTKSVTKCKKALHSLKGIALTMGAGRLADICLTIDKLIAEGEIDEAAELMLYIKPTVAESIEAIRAKLNI